MNGSMTVMHTLIHLDVPNKNGRVYPKEIMVKAVEAAPKPLVIQRINEPDGVPLLVNTVGEAVLSIDGDYVYGDYVFTDLALRDKVVKGELHVVPAGIGMLDDAGRVSDYSLSYLFLTDDPA